jgi:alkylation response protein AidB-like acyl-CoA dehydrogenase
MDASDPTNPKIVHAFMRRDDRDYEIKETWDTLGMRATRSYDTILNGVFIPDRYVARVVPAGTMDEFVLGALAWGLLGFANVYYGLALRALSLAVDAIRNKTSLGLQRSMAYHPEIQHYVADMKLEIDGLGPHVDRVTEDWSDGVDHGPAWPAVIMSAKYHAVESAKRVVDLAMDVSGGAGMFKQNELERLYRDVRCGGFHPANSALTHEIVGKTTLGVDLR